MKKMLVFLVVIGMLLSPVFAGGDEDYDGFRLRGITPSGNPILIWNCDWSWDKGYQMHADLYLETPFEENRDVEIYVYKPSTNEWFLQHTCTNVDSGGKECSFYFPVYWGMSETEEKGYANLIRAELKDGEDVYSKTFNLYISHTRTDREKVIYEKIGEFETMLAGCPSKAEGFSGVVAETTALGVDCKLNEARTKITSAINELKGYQDAGECEVVVSQQQDKPKESIPSEFVNPGTEAEEEPEAATPPAQTTSTITPPPATSATDGGSSPCPVGFLLLGLGIAAFAWRNA